MSWELVSSLVVGAALVLGFAWYERSRPPARVLALVAALAALAIVGRLAFAPFPNVKPTTDIVLFAGYALGGAPGFAVGSVTALVSNVFLTHGPWTPWQMAAWGGVGLAGGALGALVRSRSRRTTEGAEPRELGRWTLALACGVAGLGYGLVMDLYLWTFAGERTLASYAVISARSLPFNVAHVVGNVVLCLLIGPPLVLALRRYRRRFEVRWAAPTRGRLRVRRARRGPSASPDSTPRQLAPTARASERSGT
jgi:energy-coupling factor transport system substrate-specific component